MKTHIRKNDLVQVISGDHRGARGKVMRIDTDRGTVVIEGVNLVFRHVRPTRKNPQGGRVQKEAAIHLSNVLLYDSASGRGKRTRYDVTMNDAGRITAKTRMTVGGTVINVITRPDKSK